MPRRHARTSPRRSRSLRHWPAKLLAVFIVDTDEKEIVLPDK